MAIIQKFGVVILAAAWGLAGAAQTKEAPQELVQYVRDARRQGFKDPSIRQNAVASGWPAAVVEEAITSARKDPKDQATAAAKEAAPSKNPPPAPPVEVPVPQAAPAVTPAPAAPGAAADSVDTPKNRGVSEDYVIGAGDVLQISVWKEPDASVPSVVVRPDGKIAMPLLKEVEVIGMTPPQAERVITERLGKLINGADVTVVVTAIHSKKVFVVGAVKKEGPLAYTYRMSIMQAISEAGGLNDYAKRKKIYLLRTESGKDYRLPFNYDEVIKGEKMEQNILLLPGDTLVIPH